jgi:ubiquinone/menaquinone biosynthesis C-methylase UbiE
MMLINTPAYRFDKNLTLKPDQRLLDIGCGPGSLLRILAARVRFASPPAGLDISSEMLRRAGQEPGENPLELAQGSAASLPFVADVFDAVTCGYVLKHLDEATLDLFLGELLRVLKPGGFAILWEFAPTQSRRLDRLNHWVVTRGVRTANFRGFGTIAAAATRAGFDWVDNAHLRPFLFPPIPRVSLVVGKAPEGWR